MACAALNNAGNAVADQYNKVTGQTAGDKAGDAVDSAGKAIKDAGTDVKGAAEDAKNSVGRAAEKAQH